MKSIYKYYKENGESYIEFGSFPQDVKRNHKELEFKDGFYYDESNTKYVKLKDKFYTYKPIKWKVLLKDEDTLLLITDKVIDVCTYGIKNDYIDSSIREFLINDFYNNAFNFLEKLIIVDKEKISEKEADKVFLLSSIEMKDYRLGFANTNGPDIKRAKEATSYAKAKNVTMYKKNAWYVLRTKHKTEKDFVAFIGARGLLAYKNFANGWGIAPAIWIKIKMA